jgi:hypothetical protein
MPRKVVKEKGARPFKIKEPGGKQVGSSTNKHDALMSMLFAEGLLPSKKKGQGKW